MQLPDMTVMMEDEGVHSDIDLGEDPRDQFGYADAPAGVHDNFKVRAPQYRYTVGDNQIRCRHGPVPCAVRQVPGSARRTPKWLSVGAAADAARAVHETRVLRALR